MVDPARPLLSYRPLKGTGPPLLLLHGWGATFPVWQDMAALLEPHFQLVMVELPGFGGSRSVSATMSCYEECAVEIERVRQALGITSWSIVGYSIGACAGEAYRRRYREHVIRMVYLCPARLRAPLISGLRVAITLERRWPRFMDWLLSNPRWNVMVHLGLAVGSGFGQRNRRAGRILTGEMKRQSPEGLKHALRALVDWEVTLPSARDVPTLYLWGRRDPLIPRPRSSRPCDVSLPSNHNAPLLVAPQIAKYVIQFLREAP